MAHLMGMMYTGSKWCLALSLIVFLSSAANEYIAYHSGTIIGKFYGALVSHNESEFWNTFYKASLLYAGQTLMIASTTFLSWMLSYCLRKNLVRGVHSKYFQKKNYYQLPQKEEIDNPDQRITQDVEKLTTILGQTIIPSIIVAPLVIGFYSYKTWKTGGGISVACIYGYFVVGFIINRILLGPMTRWTRRQEKAEGDFRFKHMSVREHAEESAFYDSEEFEKLESDRFLEILIKTLRRYALWKYPAQWFQLFFDYYGGVLTYLIQYIPVFILNSYANMTPGELATQISNNGFFFIYLINSFTRLTDLAINISEMAAYVRRIGELVNFCEDEIKHSPVEIYHDDESLDEQYVYKLNNISINHPSNHKLIVKNSGNIVFKANKSVLITGPSGCGKTSLLRIFKRLWLPNEGSIEHGLIAKSVMFLPQKCYLPTGHLSLLDQLLFPQHRKQTHVIPETKEIMQILNELRLQKLVSLCGDLTYSSTFEWKDVLSPGEQQRISLARALIQKPRLLIMDEATTSLTETMEGIVYKLLKKYNINYITTGHRVSLYKYHDYEMCLSEDKEWKMSAIEEVATKF